MNSGDSSINALPSLSLKMPQQYLQTGHNNFLSSPFYKEIFWWLHPSKTFLLCTITALAACLSYLISCNSKWMLPQRVSSGDKRTCEYSHMTVLGKTYLYRTKLERMVVSYKFHVKCNTTKNSEEIQRKASWGSSFPQKHYSYQ
jgi:hypothetical protein